MTTKTKDICSACGNSGVNHRLLFISNSVDETLGKFGNVFSSFLYTERLRGLSVFIERRLFDLFRLAGALRFNINIEKVGSGRSKLVWEEAQKRGIEMEQLVFFGKYLEHYRAKIKGRVYYFQSLPIPPWLPQKGYEWVGDKYILAKKLRLAGIPTPSTKIISSISNARSAFEILNKPLIIKPKSGSRGRHTTTNIRNKEELENAFSLARQISPVMVLQEHLFGSVYRATVVNNKLVGFFRADPPQIEGDGIKNISALIFDKNCKRNEKLNEVCIDDNLINFIKRQEYNLESILPLGVIIDLSAKTGRFYGGYTKEMLPEVHPKMHDIFKKASEVVSAPVLGFDLIILDPTQDPDTQVWGIIECNSLPFIDLHYFALEGTPINVSKHVWDLWDI
ncbi:MAG: ATP-grasp domain-containing protein [Patescibacteria group bacterium]